MIETILYHGAEARPFLDEVARLRITVFREFPYLYEGSLEYEKEYLSNYYLSEKSLLIIVKEQTRIVGISTACPLSEAEPEFQAPIAGVGINAKQMLYFGESVLLPEFRGKGIGHRFFDLREEWARRWSFPITGFCAVVRESGHPREPADYRSLESFWISRGYAKRNDAEVRLAWSEVGDPGGKSDHRLAYWLRDSRAVLNQPSSNL